MGKGRNKKRTNNRARRDNDRAVRDYENERNTQPPDQWLVTSDDLLRRSNNSRPLWSENSSRRSRSNNNNDQPPTLIPTPSIDEVFSQVLEIIAEELESWAETLRAQNQLAAPNRSYNIENLPTRQITTADQGEEDGEATATCHICQEDIDVGTVVTWLPKCQHWFCTECLEPWLKGHNTCPTCREVVE